jgi:hypothetical protein
MHSISLTLYQGLWLASESLEECPKAAEIKVRHRAVGVDDIVLAQLSQTLNQTGRRECIPESRDAIKITVRI